MFRWQCGSGPRRVAGLVVAGFLLTFLFSIRAQAGFGYVFVQCVFKAHHSLDDYTKSGAEYGSVSAIVEGADKGWASIDFPTDKATRHNYTRSYDILLAPYQHTAKNVLELGIKKGGSIKLWREYFDAGAFIYGMDIDHGCPTFPRDGHIKSIFLDTNNREDVLKAVGDIRFDVIVDDGCHTNLCIWKSFNTLFPLLQPHGLYLVEDYPKYFLYTLEKYFHKNSSNQFYIVGDRADEEVLLAILPPSSWALQPEVTRKMSWKLVKPIGGEA